MDEHDLTTPIVPIPPELLADSDFDVWEEIRPGLVAWLEAKIWELGG